MTREEHLAWCKKRALEYCDEGQPVEAITSMLSDLSKHPETHSPALEQLTMGLLMMGSLSSVSQAKHHIEGFN